jgi:hypothetical protein
LTEELAYDLVHTPDGVPRIRRMIVEDIEHARTRGDISHMVKLVQVLRHFIETHSADADRNYGARR